MDENEDKHIEAMVDSRNPKADSARSLTDATMGEDALESYASINNSDEHSEVAQLAYQYYLERGDKHGKPEDDWMRAENEVRRRRGSSIRQGGGVAE